MGPYRVARCPQRRKNFREDLSAYVAKVGHYAGRPGGAQSIARSRDSIRGNHGGGVTLRLIVIVIAEQRQVLANVNLKNIDEQFSK